MKSGIGRDNLMNVGYVMELIMGMPSNSVV